MFSTVVRERVIDALEGTPDLLAYVLRDLTAQDPRWDVHAEPSRYSLRELLAHLADWDSIWLSRMTLTVGGMEPNLIAVDILKRAIDQGYSNADPEQSLKSLSTSRTDMVCFLRKLAPNEWKRVAFHPEEGRQSIETQAAWVLAHDDYYVKMAVRRLRQLE